MREKGEVAEAAGLWAAIVGAVPSQEVEEVRRIVGSAAIDESQALWKEVLSLEEICRDALFANDVQSLERRRATSASALLCSSQERSLLVRQIQLLVVNVQFQEMEACRTGKAGPRRFADRLRAESRHFSQPGGAALPVPASARERELLAFVNGGDDGSSAQGSLDSSQDGSRGSSSRSRPLTAKARPEESCARLADLPGGAPASVADFETLAEEVRSAFRQERGELLAAIAALHGEIEEAARDRREMEGAPRPPSTKELRLLKTKLAAEVDRREKQRAHERRLAALPSTAAAPAAVEAGYSGAGKSRLVDRLTARVAQERDDRFLDEDDARTPLGANVWR